MANINSLFEVRKSGDQEVAVRFPKGIEIGDNLDATALLKGMLELALHEEPDVVGQEGAQGGCVQGDGRHGFASSMCCGKGDCVAVY